MTEYLEGSLFTRKENCHLFKQNREKITAIGLDIFPVPEQTCQLPEIIPQLFSNGQKTDTLNNYIQQDPGRLKHLQWSSMSNSTSGNSAKPWFWSSHVQVSKVNASKCRCSARSCGKHEDHVAELQSRLPRCCLQFQAKPAFISTPTCQEMDSVTAYEMFCHFASTFQQADEKKAEIPQTCCLPNS